MRNCPALILSLAISTGSLFGADHPEIAAMEMIRSEAIRAHVEFLADDLLEGRGTGTRGYNLAAKYVAAHFKAIGLQPAGVNGTFFQSVRLRSYVVVPDETSLKLVRNGYEESLVYGQDFSGGADARATVSSLSGQIVYIGHGVEAPEFGVEDYKGLDVRGKIVAFLPGAPSTLPSEERAHLGTIDTKLEAAAAHGAIGMLNIWDARSRRNIFSRSAQFRVPRMRWLAENGLPSGDLQEIRMVGALSESATKKLLAGSSRPGPLDASISLRTTTTHSEITGQNVVAVLRGSDPKLRDEYLIYTAHVDHLGIGEAVGGDNIYNGALDNATGTAGLIEVARAFAGLEPRPRRSIIFLAVTGEENGHLGSDFFAEHPTVPRSQIVANVNLDELNVLFDFRDLVVFGADHSSLGTDVAKATAMMGLTATPDPTPEQRYFVRGDQYSFVKRGIPAICPFFGTKASDPHVDAAKMIADWESSRYHKPSDDLSQPMDFAAGAKNARFDFLLGYLIAQDDARPQWNSGDFFAKTFATRK